MSHSIISISTSHLLYVMDEVHTLTHPLIHTLTQKGFTALNLSASQGREDIVDLLLEANPDPDIKDTVVIDIALKTKLSGAVINDSFECTG